MFYFLSVSFQFIEIVMNELIMWNEFFDCDLIDYFLGLHIADKCVINSITPIVTIKAFV